MSKPDWTAEDVIFRPFADGDLPAVERVRDAARNDGRETGHPIAARSAS